MLEVTPCVFPLRSVVPVVLVLLVSAVSVAQSPQKAVGRVRKERQVLLRADEAATLHMLRVAPGVVTTVLFDADILPESVERASLEKLFARVDVYARAVILKPALDMPGVSPPLLAVRFAGEAAPSRVTFLLTTDATEVDAQVEVFRRELPSEELGAELTSLRARCAATEAGLAALRAQCAVSGLGGAILTGVIDQEGVRSTFFEISPVESGLEAPGPLSLYRSGATRAFVTTLSNPRDARTWTPEMARLTRLGMDGKPASAPEFVPVLMLEKRLQPGASGLAVVEWRVPAGQAPGLGYVLEVLDHAGVPVLRWDRVPL